MRGVSGIYAITNKVNGKRYVGQAASIGDRWLTHKSHLNTGRHHSRHLQASWNKHGAEAFDFTLLELVPADKDVLAVREQFWFDLLRPEYNAAPVAGSSLGLKHPPRSEEFRRKQSEMKRGFKHSLEAIARFREIADQKRADGTMYRPTEEHREKLRQANIGKKHSAETIEKWRAKVIGRKQPAEEIAKRSAANRGRKRTPEQCERISRSLIGKRLGKKLSESTKEKIGAAHRGRKRPDVGLKLSGRKRPSHVGAAIKAAADIRFSAKRAALIDVIKANPLATLREISAIAGCEREMAGKYKRQILGT